MNFRGGSPRRSTWTRIQERTMVDEYLSEREQAEQLRHWLRENWIWLVAGVPLDRGRTALRGHARRDRRQQARRGGAHRRRAHGRICRYALRGPGDLGPRTARRGFGRLRGRRKAPRRRGRRLQGPGLARRRAPAPRARATGTRTV